MFETDEDDVMAVVFQLENVITFDVPNDKNHPFGLLILQAIAANWVCVVVGYTQASTVKSNVPNAKFALAGMTR